MTVTFNGRLGSSATFGTGPTVSVTIPGASSTPGILQVVALTHLAGGSGASTDVLTGLTHIATETRTTTVRNLVSGAGPPDRYTTSWWWREAPPSNPGDFSGTVSTVGGPASRWAIDLFEIAGSYIAAPIASNVDSGGIADNTTNGTETLTVTSVTPSGGLFAQRPDTPGARPTVLRQPPSDATLTSGNPLPAVSFGSESHTFSYSGSVPAPGLFTSVLFVIRDVPPVAQYGAYGAFSGIPTGITAALGARSS